jgi:hypothetical protein
MTPRQKWFAYLRGEEVGPMMAPLVDNWCLEEPYAWTYDEPDPYPAGHPQHGFSQQMAMAKLCGYDPLYLVGVPYVARTPVERTVTTREEAGHVITETRTHTPLGDLLLITEHAKTVHTLKPEVQDAADYDKMLWVIAQEGQLDADASASAGQALLAPMGEKGVVGTWWGPPGVRGVDREDQFVHMAEFPELTQAVIDATFATQMAQLDILKAMGFDYLFYCADGTEWISPGYFEEFVAPATAAMFEKWRALGGFVVWHTCGHSAEFIKRGYYNTLLPEIFETMSEPPFGTLPSLRWGRERLDPRIATKGNIDLQLIHDGPTDAIRAEVRRIKAETAGWRHIIGGSDDILDGTPRAHLEAMLDETLAE